ncbi:MAG TPA: rod shape-determining protein MreD [Candidatus Omnitrophota bacterium]|nr:rod shape-determining protein MreD [Candidatus Omnitrophota bacterium]HPT06862.1 rod shape-determining protein MreD [Candidatus Omnitrophota bacterium]
MKRKFLFFLIILAVACMQATVLNCVSLFGVKPDVLLLLVIVCGLYFSPGWALGYSIVAGCCKDLFTASGWGINIVLFAVLSILLEMLRKRIRFDNQNIRLSVVYLSCLAYYLSSVVFIPRSSVIPTGVFLRSILVGPIYGAALFFFALRWIDKALKPFSVSSEPDDETDFDPDFEAYM